MARWHLRIGDEVRTKIALKEAAIICLNRRTGKWAAINDSGIGTIPANTIGEVIDILGDDPNHDDSEVCCSFEWADENGVFYSSVNSLNHEKWLERTPCIVGN